MKTVNMHEAKTHLSKLVDAAVRGEAFVIAKAGKPLVRVEKVSAEAPRRTGFLKGAVDVPPDFDTMEAEAIRTMFEGPGPKVDPGADLGVDPGADDA